MRRSRQRRRDGIRFLMIELRETEIDALVSMGLLTEDARNHPNDVRKAIYDFLEQVLA